MYQIPKRTEAQKRYWSTYRHEEWKQEERQRRMKFLSHVTIRKDTNGYQTVYYKDYFICCLFDNDECANERIIRIIVNLLEAIE